VPAYVTEDGEYAILAEGEPSGSWTLYRRVIVVGTRREAGGNRRGAELAGGVQSFLADR
jgi:hypothetical protein